jgi:glycosyltransferase involved in cell wall biosynthesis
MIDQLPFISIVVIGYNEQAHLETTFNALKSMNYPLEKVELLYVDSGSADESLEIAKRYAHEVFIERTWPTAARNRNRGLVESKYDLVHFIDGDIEIAPDYLAHAVNIIQTGQADGVFGKLEERSDKGLGKVLLHDYGNRHTGYVNAPGSGGTFRKEALLAVGGWDERIPRGEETELGIRLRQQKFRIWFTEKTMGTHDYGVRHLCDFLKKQVVEGISYGRISKISSDGVFYRKTRKQIRNNLIFHTLLLVVLLWSLLLRSSWPAILSFGVFVLFLFAKYCVIKKIKNPDSLRYYFLMNLTRSFVLFGYLKFLYQFSRLSAVQKRQAMEKMNGMKQYRRSVHESSPIPRP